jgi:hypothetical protein
MLAFSGPASSRPCWPSGQTGQTTLSVLARFRFGRYRAGMAAAPYPQVPRSAWEGAETVYFPYADLNFEILDAIHHAVPDGATFGFNHDYRRAWVTVTKPGKTRDVLLAAFRSVGRELRDDPGEG